MCPDLRPDPGGQTLPPAVAPISRVAAPGPAEPPPPVRAISRWYALPGFAILVSCMLLGDKLKEHFGLVLPGNILGLFILLALLAFGVVPLRWVEGVARWLLWLLPLLFVPIFVLALKDRTFWATRGPLLITIMSLATLLLWAVTGHLTQWLLKRGRS
jgi:holin-like protein